jgi:hypothetical protein
VTLRLFSYREPSHSGVVGLPTTRATHSSFVLKARTTLPLGEPS